MKIFLTIFCFFIFGCSTASSQPSKILQPYFEVYKSSVGSSTEQNFITSELWETLQTARRSVDKSEFVNAIAYFPQEMVLTTDFKELINETEGCLLVSGTTATQVLLDYYINYIYSDNDWLIKDITVKYFLDGSKRYLNYAECDEDKRMSLWLESVQ